MGRCRDNSREYSLNSEQLDDWLACVGFCNDERLLGVVRYKCELDVDVWWDDERGLGGGDVEEGIDGDFVFAGIVGRVLFESGSEFVPVKRVEIDGIDAVLVGHGRGVLMVRKHLSTLSHKTADVTRYFCQHEVLADERIEVVGLRNDDTIAAQYNVFEQRCKRIAGNDAAVIARLALDPVTDTELQIQLQKAQVEELVRCSFDLNKYIVISAMLW